MALGGPAVTSARFTAVDEIHRTMQISGRIAVLSVFALAVTLSAGAWWYHYRATKRMADFWGPAAANLLVRGELVDAYRLEPQSPPPASNDFPDWPPPFAKLLEGSAVQHVDLTGAKGLIHLRHALTQDSNYLWDAAQQDAAPPWAFAFRFSDGDDATWILLSDEFDYLGRPTNDDAAIDLLAFRPEVGPVLREYFTDIGLLGDKEAESAAADVGDPSQGAGGE